MKNHTLTKIDLGKNHLGKMEGKQISNSIMNNQTLIEIELRWNNIKPNKKLHKRIIIIK